MKRLCTLLAMAFVFSTCDNDKDPGPDLSSSTISFTWDHGMTQNRTYYAVISDTVGNVLQWAELPNKQKVEMPYPPDPKLALVTIITRDDGAYKSTGIATYTDLPAGDYAYTLATAGNDFPDTYYTLNIENRSQYQNITIFVKPEFYSTYDDLAGDIEKYSLGLYNRNQKNDLYISMAKSTNNIRRQLYIEDIKGGELLTVTPTSFADDFEDVPVHVLNYPQHSTMDYSLIFVSGYTTNSGGWTLDFTSPAGNQIPKISYPDIPGLFETYGTTVISFGKDGTSWSSDTRDDQPNINITLINSTLNKMRSVNTKRISADFTADADVVTINGTFGNFADGVNYSIFTPMTSKVRINPPQFPQDLIDKIANLSSLKDGKDFEWISTDQYNISYTEFSNRRITGSSNWTEDYKSRSYDVSSSSSGRRMIDPKEALRRYGRESLLKGIKLE